MSEWRSETIERVTEILDNQRVPVRSDDRPTGSVPYYGANGRQGWIDHPIFDEPLILVAEDGGNFDLFEERPIAYRIDGPSWVNNHAHVLRAAPGIDQSFLFWSLRNKDIRRWITGGTRSKLNRGELEQVELSIPPLDEQQRIAEILDTIDETIQATERVIAKLQLHKTGLTNVLVADAERSGRAGILGDAVPRVEYGISLPLSRSGTTPVLRMGNLSGGSIRADDLRFTNVPATALPLLRRDDVLFNRTNSIDHVGKTSIWKCELPEATFASYLVRLHPTADLIPDYLNLWLNLEQTQLFVKRLSTTAIQQVNINPTKLRSTPMLLPSVDAQLRVIFASQAADDSLNLEARKLGKLQNLRSGVAADLLSGRVRTVAS